MTKHAPMANQTARCQQCGKDISRKRSDAKFCDDRCRMRQQRLRLKLKLIRELAELCNKVPNHIRKNEFGLIEVAILNSKTGQYEMFDKKVLLKFSTDRLRRLVKQKRYELMGAAFSAIMNRG